MGICNKIFEIKKEMSLKNVKLTYYSADTTNANSGTEAGCQAEILKLSPKST